MNKQTKRNKNCECVYLFINLISKPIGSFDSVVHMPQPIVPFHISYNYIAISTILHILILLHLNTVRCTHLGQHLHLLELQQCAI